MVLCPLLVLALALPAQAGHEGEIRFLADGDYGALGDGRLALEAPEAAAPGARLLLPGQDLHDPARFLMDGDAQERIQGRLMAGLWLDEPPQVAGEAHVVLMTVGPSGATELARAPFSFGGSTPEAPDPATLLPSDPNDPEAAAWHAIAQAHPMVTSAPVLADFGTVDIQVPADGRLAVALQVADGSLSTLALEYGAASAPSFLYLPWHEAQAPSQPAPSQSAPEPDKSTPAPSRAAGTAPTVGADDEPPAGKDTPAAGALAGLVAVGAAALLLRRRD